MGITDTLNGGLDYLFRPLLEAVSPFWFVLIISVIIAVITILAYKFFTNQQLMKSLKMEIKELQKQAKALRSEPEKAMTVNKKVMETNMKYMMQSFKVTFITIIPVLLLYGYMQANIAYEPLEAGEEFGVVVGFEDGISGMIATSSKTLEVTGGKNKTISGESSTFTYKGPNGLHSINYELDGKSYTHDVLITSERRYRTPEQRVKDDKIKTITTTMKKTPVLKILGWELGWFWSYIILVVALSMILRKLFKVY